MPAISSIGGAVGFGRAVAATAQQPIVSSGLLVNLDAATYSGSGTTWTDQTGNGNNATLINTPTYSSLQGGYFTFLDTAYEYATIANIGNRSTWTIESWFRATASLSGKVTAIVANQFDLVNKLNFSIGTNRAPISYNLCAGYYDGAWRTTNGFAPTLNTWIHVVGTYDGTTIKEYANGVLDTTLTVSGTPQSGGEVRIARRWDESVTTASNFFKGDISIVRIYNRALSNSEITQNYNAIRGRYL